MPRLRQQPTVADAEKILARAYIELRKAKGNRLKRRQAAEKGWLAIRTASLAVLACAGRDWQSGGEVARRIEDLERELDPHQKPLTSAAYRARDALHGACFYSGDTRACETRAIKDALDQIQAALPRSHRLCALARRRNGNGRQQKRG